MMSNICYFICCKVDTLIQNRSFFTLNIMNIWIWIYEYLFWWRRSFILFNEFYDVIRFYPLNNPRTYSERRRRTGTGRKREIFEEKAAASEDEYFRKETARQLKELKEKQRQIKKAKKNKKNDKAAEKEKQKKPAQADKKPDRKW